MNQVIGLVMALAAVVHAWSMHGFQPDVPTELVKPRFLNTHLHEFRSRRAVDVINDVAFPDTLQINVTTNDNTVTLDLTYSDVNWAWPTVYEFNDAGYVVVKNVVVDSSYAFYQDVTTGASFLVACNSPAVEQCSLSGSFYNRQYKVLMQPAGSFASTGLHEVQEIEEGPLDFGDDTVPVTEYEGPIVPDDEDSWTRKKRDMPDARKKRALPDGVNVVETLAFPDASFYARFLASEQGNEEEALKAMMIYLGMLFNEIDLHYVSISQIDPRLTLRVTLAGIMLATDSQRDAPWSYIHTYTIGGTQYLDRRTALFYFSNWRYGIRFRLPAHDHAMGLTGKDIAYLSADKTAVESSSVIGYAYRPGICRNIRVSLSELYGTRAALVLAHELGHNLGAQHDVGTSSHSTDGCPSSQLYVMTPFLSSVLGTSDGSLAPAQWTFSYCSIQDIRLNI